MKIHSLPLSLFVLLAASLPVLAAAPTHKPSGLIQPFNYSDVTLSGGPLAAQAQSTRELYLALPTDDILNGFRLRAGLPAPGKAMGGWYDPDDFAGGCTLGQWISALSRDYANTGDARFKAKVDELVHGFHETIAPDGFFFISKKISTNWPCYTYDKNCTGMRDAYTFAGNREALDVLKVMTDWAFTKMPRRKDEWYTLPENFLNCYTLTGDARYLQMAHEYDYSRPYYDTFAGGTNAFTPKRHAYSHINSLCSAAKFYETTGDEKYFRAIANAFDFLTNSQMYASGGWGPDERFVVTNQGKLAAWLVFETNRWNFRTQDGDYGNDFETPCGSYANINLDRYLLRFTADPKYGDNLERVLYNGILAALPMEPDGRTFYYSDYHPGAHKQYFPKAWPCCSGTYPEVTADYPVDIYFHDDDGLYVNLFTPSEVRWQHDGKTITVGQATDFPQSDSSTFTVHVEKMTRFALNLRVPEWVSQPLTVEINHRPEKIKAVPGTFLKISRRWQDGDTLTLTLPKSLRFDPVDAQDPQQVALMYGPVLLVAMADGEVKLRGDQAHPEKWIQLQDAGTLTFRAANGQLFRPFYQLNHERYTTYCRVASADQSLK
jgi:DUF1680 family protein